MTIQTDDVNTDLLKSDNPITRGKLDRILEKLKFPKTIKEMNDQQKQCLFVVVVREYLKCNLFLEDLSDIAGELQNNGNPEFEDVLKSASKISTEIRNLSEMKNGKLDEKFEKLFSFFKENNESLSDLPAPFNELSYFEKNVDERKYIDENGKLNPPNFSEMREKVSARYGNHKPLVTDMDGFAIIDFPLPRQKLESLLRRLHFPTERKDLSLQQAKVFLFAVIKEFVQGKLYFEDFCAMLEWISYFFLDNKSEDKINGYSLDSITLDALDMCIDVRKFKEGFSSPLWFMLNLFEYAKQHTMFENEIAK